MEEAMTDHEQDYDTTPIEESTRRREELPRTAPRLLKRDGEEEWMFRPVNKQRAVVRYEQEFANMRRGEFTADDYENDKGSFCFNIADNTKSTATYEEAKKIKYKNDWLKAMKSEIIAWGHKKIQLFLRTRMETVEENRRISSDLKSRVALAGPAKMARRFVVYMEELAA
ncbi:uncharacterized protein PHALS_03495 [Plasmopara halstedii]|uniref:Uncharacterized protein n=1 Tax=Plasmopara halstedii TaxID=4781 RepID=A0A0P1AZM7_PLAHL|nr:uncharacterized protein PHALS_03495 [Plasmopara halstedii]CEG46815.1 hypothetical protein PHALS_03495 [Plasmopara halstedii]|eukprot:XP_024583184.1 hypothetical protein PHALS_03495 [Plasmopara halstedii]